MEGDAESQNNLPKRRDTPEPPAEAEVVSAEEPAEDPDKELSAQEREYLTELEDGIEAGIDRWLAAGVEVGRKLAKIQDQKPYREDYGTFENYCKRRWKIERAQGNRLVDYARVADAVSPTGDISIPASERQARELSVLARKDPPAARRVWERLLEDTGGRPRSYTRVKEAARPELERLQTEKENAARTSATDPSAKPPEEDPEASIAFNGTRVSGWRRGDFGKEENLRTLPNNSVRLLLADPPYGVDRKSNSKQAHERIPSDKTSEEAEELLKRMLREMRPKLAPDAHVVIFCAPINEGSMRRIVEAEPDLDIRSYPVWVKNAHSPGDTVYGLALQHERMIHATKGNPAVSPGLADSRPSDVFQHSRVAADKHPTRKPAALLWDIIGAFTDVGDLVADPVAGSGSTLVAALQRGRRAWGAEISKGYYDEGSERIAEELHRAPAGEPEDSGATRVPGVPAPEVRSETPKEADARLIERIYGLRDPLTDARSSPPEDEAYPFAVLRRWLSSLPEKPRTLVEPFAFHHGQSGLLVAMARPPRRPGAEELPELDKELKEVLKEELEEIEEEQRTLDAEQPNWDEQPGDLEREPLLAGRVVLIESEESQDAAAAWRTLIEEPSAARLMKVLGLWRHGFGSISREEILATLAAPEPFIANEEISASPEARAALQLLFGLRPFWIAEMARAAEPGRPLSWNIKEAPESAILSAEEREAYYQQESEILEREDLGDEDREMLDQERETLRISRSIRRLTEPLEENLRRLAGAVETGGVEFRKPGEAAGGIPGSGLEALEDPELADDPKTAFFVVPPRNIGHEDTLRLLPKLAGDGIAVVMESRRAVARARDLGLEVRRLGSGRIADHEPGTLMLVGKDLAFADAAR